MSKKFNKKSKVYFENADTKNITAAYDLTMASPFDISVEANDPIIFAVQTFYGSDMYMTPEDIFNLRGKATCHGTDAYSEAVGKDVAGIKLDLKYHQRMSNDYGKVIRRLEKSLDNARKMMEFHNNKIENINDDLIRMYDYKAKDDK